VEIQSFWLHFPDSAAELFNLFKKDLLSKLGVMRATKKFLSSVYPFLEPVSIKLLPFLVVTRLALLFLTEPIE
jgi:hypothetical protein